MPLPTFREFSTILFGVVLDYDTPKYVHIRNWKIGAINRLVQLVIIGYIIGYGIVYQHGYRESGPFVSVVTSKVKGAEIVFDTDEWMDNCPKPLIPETLLDHTDLVIPPQEPNSFFVTTNMWMTCNQTLGICPEEDSVTGAKCTSNSDCEEGEMLLGGNGIMTGNCSEDNTGRNGTCIVIAWCPIEQEDKNITNRGPKIDTRNFTVLVKNSISFPDVKPNFHVRNIPASASSHFLKNCTFDNKTKEGQTCPIFSLGQIVGMINGTEGFYDYLATEGAVVALRIAWDCNLDSNPENCLPKYSARRLDNPVSNVSPGYNFRYPRYHYVGDVQYRDLVKAYGILFVIQVTGQGYYFSFTSLVLKLGSMIALLAVATTICDIIVLYLFKRGSYYRKKKYQEVDPTEENNSSGSGFNQYGTLGDSDTVSIINK